MFSENTYKERRNNLLNNISSGVIVIPGNKESSINFKDNWYQFRQDSTFLYYCGLQQPDLYLVLDTDKREVALYGNEITIDDIIWSGTQPTLKERARKSGITEVKSLKELRFDLQKALLQSRNIHALPSYRPEHQLFWNEIVGWESMEASEELIHAVVAQRNVKTEEEIMELDEASVITGAMHREAMLKAVPGMYEHQVRSFVTQKAMEKGGELSFPVIATINGHILHNHFYGNQLSAGRLMILDCGAENAMGYAGDRTSTFPVNATFTANQKDIYQAVWESYQKAVSLLKPGVSYLSVHLEVAKSITDSLKSIGIMKGNTEDAVAQGAHALFMPHGLGHMMGLDVHDMENLGEHYVGYDDKYKKSDKFGLRSLRLGKELQEGFVLTVEPGIYLIPELIKQWKNENNNTEFINFDFLESFDFQGGVRIEDDYLIEENGGRMLGDSLPRTVEEIEEIRKEALS